MLLPKLPRASASAGRAPRSSNRGFFIAAAHAHHASRWPGHHLARCPQQAGSSSGSGAGAGACSSAPQHVGAAGSGGAALSSSRAPRAGHLRRAHNEGGQDASLDDYVEVRIESVRVSQGASVVYLRVVGSDAVVPVHIGENESNALLREINKQRQMRPLTHDLMKNMLQDIGYRVTKVRVTDIIANTFYARVHVARAPPGPGPDGPGGPGPGPDGASSLPHEVDVDARPSDAINLAVRFGAPVYISRKIAESAQPVSVEQLAAASSNETHADIVRSVREMLASYEDPTVMFQLQKELAVKDERFEDARAAQDHIVHEMTHNRLLRLVVAMESALADGRYEEAAHLRDEYRRALTEQQQQEEQQQAAEEMQQAESSSSSSSSSSTADQRKLL